MKVGEKGLALIKESEGLRLKAYKPVASEKYYTIGWGHYGADVVAGMEISESRAVALLKQDLHLHRGSTILVSVRSARVLCVRRLSPKPMTRPSPMRL